MDFNATFTLRPFILRPRIAGRQAEKEQNDLYHFKQSDSNISFNRLAVVLHVYMHPIKKQFQEIIYYRVSDHMPLMRNKSESHLYIATAGVKTTQKSVFFSKMKHVQNAVLQEDV